MGMSCPESLLPFSDADPVAHPATSPETCRKRSASGIRPSCASAILRWILLPKCIRCDWVGKGVRGPRGTGSNKEFVSGTE